MPISIVLSNLSWSTPDGRPLLSHLDLSFGAERTGLVGRNGVGKTTLIKLVSGELQPQSGNISFNGRLGILRQSVQVEADETVADLFGASEALTVLKRAEAGEATNDELASADWTLEARIAAALDRIGLDVTPETPLMTLSGGQRTRCGLAALIVDDPDFLILDEPTNNLDRDGRAAVIDLLAGWRAGAIVISHDRELLDTMDAIVELTPLGASRYGGNWTQYRERKALELSAAEHDFAEAEKRVAEVERSAQAAVERQARRDKAGRKMAAKGGIPRIMLGGLKERAETTSAENTRLAERRRAQALRDAAAAREKIEILQPLTVKLPTSGLPSNRIVLRMEGVTAGYEPERPILRDFNFIITGPERVAVTGPNGSGKTTLLALVSGALKPWSGTVRVVHSALLDQRVSLLDPSISIRDNFRRINPDADENACRAALARFMFRADAALQIVSSLSGGQLLRAGLACVLGGTVPPSLLILDEPTNHLDIDSIAAVEAGLRAYDGALLVVSHDEVFLDNIGIERRLELPARAVSDR
ncbi:MULTISPECIES: ABC-F family ATP-binding cassette domain-containing protein [unclassified Rhizobium]|uniref:ABC-F family ATP-binding cassette domain-containing protein n=1 Tax=unclassified Rhizobium TaxID=2613769 RepID=UPI00084C64E3|nr:MULTISPECIES: ABC-F family ATP-binding cassette domain-containing protein [unclassified Rhizobium]OEC98601.1 ABC transporter [Rhizobium sp. YK2]QYA12771.1 ABC-F family ATP-binding cassette domain-containing protein [Rhizobium sp. AB2/73]UEQ81296.1 ABC-F family ATP-binding cassette domain-containing protein [Rhizobium sp. AB2/73]